jgi:hypothetical protein
LITRPVSNSKAPVRAHATVQTPMPSVSAQPFSMSEMTRLSSAGGSLRRPTAARSARVAIPVRSSIFGLGHTLHCNADVVEDHLIARSRIANFYTPIGCAS